MDFDEYETLPTKNFLIHMTAGAIAGVLEHCIMYPVDSVKTRMQSLSPHINYSSPLQGLGSVVRQEGFFRLFRGVGVVMAGAGPAHAMYFSVYEHVKDGLQESVRTSPYVAAGFSGMIATIFHDTVMTPTEVVKQRLQMYKSPYKSIFDCISRTYKAEGVRAFYRSYTTQLAMNIPFQIIHFIMYETCQNLTNKERVYNPSAHVTSGAIAGATAAALTTPLDVVKTLLNTQQHKVKGMLAGIRTVYKVGGFRGFLKGLSPRVLYQMPSTAICWTVYELFKYYLAGDKHEVKCSDKSLSPTVLVSDRQKSSMLRPVLLIPEVNVKPFESVEQNCGFENVITASCHVSDFSSESWNNSIPSTLSEDSIGNYKIEEKFRSQDKPESSIVEKTEWSSSVIPGGDVFG